MARYKRLETLLLMKDIGLIPVFYNSDFEVAKKVICAREDGEAKIIEFTNRGDRAISVFTRLEEFCEKERPGFLLDSKKKDVGIEVTMAKAKNVPIPLGAVA